MFERSEYTKQTNHGGRRKLNMQKSTVQNLFTFKT